nr:glycoside hydrolase family 43 protein [Hymenobacter rubidus]
MKTNYTALLVCLLLPMAVLAQRSGPRPVRQHVPLDSIRLSDPFILADAKTHLYYMTGTGGLLWKSPDLKFWDGPYEVAQPDPASWMGPKPMIWAAELHLYKGKYYYFATFTNSALKVSASDGRQLERRACHVLVSDQPDGPYKPMSDATYMPANRLTLDATLWVEKGRAYMVYCDEWLNNMNGTVEQIALKPDFSGTVGEGRVLFRASDSPWSRENPRSGPARPNKVTDGPFVFQTKTGRLGMLWTSWVYDVYTQGVAYSTSGKLAGPWVQEPAPITPPNYGHGMLFRTFGGKTLMALHSHRDEHGQYIRIPRLFEVDLTGDKLVPGQPYQP